MKPAAEIRQKLGAGQVVVGTLEIQHNWPGLVEQAKDAGLDYLMVDMEHADTDRTLVAQICSVGRMVDFAVLVRPGGHDFRSVSSTLDLGPCGLMLPCVETGADLDVVRDAIYLPPRGRRRPGGPVVQWLKDIRYTTWRNEIEENVIVIPQIETPTGLENVEAIAKHEITTAIGVGPYDLCMSLVGDWAPEHPDMLAAFARIRKAGEAAGKPSWRIADEKTLIAGTDRFMCLLAPTFYLTEGLRQAAEAVRQ